MSKHEHLTIADELCWEAVDVMSKIAGHLAQESPSPHIAVEVIQRVKVVAVNALRFSSGNKRLRYLEADLNEIMRLIDDPEVHGHADWRRYSLAQLSSLHCQVRDAIQETGRHGEDRSQGEAKELAYLVSRLNRIGSPETSRAADAFRGLINNPDQMSDPLLLEALYRNTWSHVSLLLDTGNYRAEDGDVLRALKREMTGRLYEIRLERGDIAIQPQIRIQPRPSQGYFAGFFQRLRQAVAGS